MRNLLILLFFLIITIGSNTFCTAQTDSAKTNSAQTQQTQTAQNPPAVNCYLCYLKEKPFAHWETWVIMLVIFVISGLFSAPEWEKEGLGDITEGFFLVIIAIVGFILAALLACAYESFLIFVAFCMSCLFGIVVLGQIIARHRDGR